MDEHSVNIKDLITNRGFTYESLLETMNQGGMTPQQRKEIEARYLYILGQSERKLEISKFLRRNYGEHTDLQIIADLIETNPAQEKFLTTHATHAFYVQVLMDLQSITKRQAIKEAAKHFSVSEGAIEQSLKRTARDKS